LKRALISYIQILSPDILTYNVGVVTLHTTLAVAANWNPFDFQIIGIASQTAYDVYNKKPSEAKPIQTNFSKNPT